MAEYYEYTTLQGDTFDMVALDFYNEESYASVIIQANPAHCKTIIFDAGVTLKIPIIEEKAQETLPPWKR
ncbi:tail protein X [Anaerobacterium chartisolvens]|uniref:Tail protein X n=1 Tax=Anaerobacterium chartisolvens TaxID=1297424 RepID=A0A369BK80_9FIRM|nr:tail protein X [Anaerobacterium chartisolvens]RCX20877.1 tail protein X [Anaerobacterium chartisolvens]